MFDNTLIDKPLRISTVNEGGTLRGFKLRERFKKAGSVCGLISKGNLRDNKSRKWNNSRHWSIVTSTYRHILSLWSKGLIYLKAGWKLTYILMKVTTLTCEQKEILVSMKVIYINKLSIIIVNRRTFIVGLEQ